jgi:hypothetical protein
MLAELAAAAEGQPWGAAARAAIASAEGDLTKAVDHLLAHPYSPGAWALDDATTAIPALDADRLVALVNSRHTQDTLRIRAFDELLSRETLDDTAGTLVVAAMLRRSDTTRAHLLDRPDGTVGDPLRHWLKEGWASLEKDDGSLGVEERVDALTRPVEDLAAAATSNVHGLDAWQALSFYGGAELADRARTVLRSGGHEFVEGLGEADDARLSSVRTFVAAQGRAAALRVLSRLPARNRHPDDVDLALAELADDEYMTVQTGLDALVALAGREHLPALFQSLPKALRRHETQAVLRRIVELGGTEAARTLAGDEDDEVAAAGVRALAADPAVEAPELVDLLRHSDTRVRRAALVGVTARLDRDALGALLDSYPAARDTYYYDVVTALDWELHAPDNAPKTFD